MSRNEAPESKHGAREREIGVAPVPSEGQSVPMGSLGAWLRAQREARGVSLREIADASKISLRHLEALEKDRFDALPAPVFVRGFLREYGRIVGLDVDEVVNVYLLAAAAARPAEEPRRDLAGAKATSARRTSALGYGLLVAALLAVILGAAAAVSFWLGRQRPVPASPAADRATPAVEARSPGPAASEPPPPEPDRSAIATPEAPRPAPEPSAAPPSAPWIAAPPASPTAGGPQGETVPQPLRVVLEFQQDCWVEVVVDGRRRESELKAGGETWAIEARESVVLTLGNAPAVRVEVDGRPVELPTLGTRVVREFRIDRDSIGPVPPDTELAGT